MRALLKLETKATESFFDLTEILRHCGPRDAEDIGKRIECNPIGALEKIIEQVGDSLAWGIRKRLQAGRALGSLPGIKSLGVVNDNLIAMSTLELDSRGIPQRGIRTAYMRPQSACAHTKPFGKPGRIYARLTFDKLHKLHDSHCHALPPLRSNKPNCCQNRIRFGFVYDSMDTGNTIP